MVYLKIRRLIDIILSSLGLIILSPVILVLIIAIKLDSLGPVLFKQKRVGTHKCHFHILKFRTMRIDTPKDTPTHLLENPDQWITKVGKFLRRTSLDELPQIWNIFVGQMSIIGPRPALWNQYDLIQERDKYGANDVPVGLTGWAQINGRDEIEIDEKARLDGEYAEKIGFLMDARCFFGTIFSVIRSDGVVEGGIGVKARTTAETSASNCMNSKAAETMTRMKILVVSQYYFPEQFRINDICEQLVVDGHFVTVLTGLPNYPKGEVPNEYKWGKRRKEVVNGVDVIRSFEVARGNGAIRLGLNYLSYMFSASLKIFFMKKDFDLIFVYQLSPVTMAFPAIIAKKITKLPIYLYSCDIWPDSMKNIISDENSIVYKLLKKISTYIYSQSDGVGITSKPFFRYFNKVHSIPMDKISYIPQHAEETYLSINEPEDNGIVDFVFMGNIGIAQDIDCILDAVQKLKSDFNFKVHFVGDGSYLENSKLIVNEKGLSNHVVFHGRHPLDYMPKYYMLADACLLTLKGDSLVGLTMPSKLQGYMAAGRPVIGAINGAAQEVIKESKCGECVNASDSKALAKAMKDFIENPNKYKNCGNNGRKYFIDNFTKDIYMKKLTCQFMKVLEAN